MTRQIDQVTDRLAAMSEKQEHLEQQLALTKEQLDGKTKEANLRLKSQDEHDKEIEALKRELNMKEIEINIHDKKMKQLKEENIKARMLQDPRGGQTNF